MILETDFLDHWKTRWFIQLIGYQHATHHILRLWFHCQNRKKWEFPDMTDDVLKVICGYEGDGETLRTALVTVGFALGYPNSELGYSTGISVPNWAEMNAKLIANWNNGDKGGRPKSSPRKPAKNNGKTPTTNPSITQPKPNDNPQLTDRLIDRVDKEIEEPAIFKSDNVFQDLPKQLDADDFKRTWLEWEDYYKKKHGRAFQPMSRGPAWRQIMEDFGNTKDAVKAIDQAMARGYPQYYKSDKPKASTASEEPVGGRREDPAYVAEYMAKREQAAKYLAERQAAKAKEAANANAS